MIRTGISTSEAVAEALNNAGTPLSYGATAESWREAFTTISGGDESITPRETEGVTGWSSTNETALKTFNAEEGEIEILAHLIDTNSGNDITSGVSEIIAVPLIWSEEEQTYIVDESRPQPTAEYLEEDNMYKFTGVEAGDFGVAIKYAGEHQSDVLNWTSSKEVIIEFFIPQN